MVYDDRLAERMRLALNSEPAIEEKRMMGGVCFMVDGHMVGGAHQEKTGERRFMFRVGKDNMQLALLNPKARQVTMGKRMMGGFIHVTAEECSDAELREWLGMCVGFVRTLPPKAEGK